MSIKFNRRQLLGSLGAAAALGLLAKRSFIDKYGKRTFQGNVFGANFKRGHHLLKKDFPSPTKIIKEEITIVGGGVSGLSAAYHLTKAGYKNISLYELEDHLGGNSHALNESAPWGAHYLPLVNETNHSLKSFLKETGAIIKEDVLGTHYNELMICSDPMEKLYLYGRMQEGLVPQMGISEKESEEIAKFFEIVEELKNKKGKDGKYAFEIPIDMSSKDREFLKFDSLTMKEFIESKGLTSPAITWYVNYCCRDDYGTSIEEISAWAGLHYFAARRGEGVNLKDDSVMTWPQGNNYLISELERLSSLKTQKSTMLYHCEGKELFFYDFEKQESFKVISENTIFALPQFILAKIFDLKTTFTYAPWMVANIKVKWDEDLAHNLAWDNVNYHGKGLGVVVSNHQSWRRGETSTYLTYYWPLTQLSPKKARTWAIGRTHEQWTQDILRDLSPMVFDLEERIKSIDIWPWGHAMVRPHKNFLFSEREKVIPKVAHHHFAHTDLSGLSLFEEGFYQGEKAAKSILKNYQRGHG